MDCTRRGRAVDELDKTAGVPVVETGGGGNDWAMSRLPYGDASLGPRVVLGRRESDLRHRFSVVPSLCFEIVFPGLVAARRSSDSVAILNLANDSWSLHADASHQQIHFARFRAIEQRLSVVRAAHGGISAVIDPLGRVVRALPFDTEVSMWVEIRQWRGSRTLERLAIAVLLLGGAGIGMSLAWALTRRRTP